MALLVQFNTASQYFFVITWVEDGIRLIVAEILEEDDLGAYEEFLCTCDFSLVQHSIDWRNVISESGEDKPFFIVAKDGEQIVGCLPLYYFKSIHGSILVSNVWYTFSGILAVAKNKKEIYKKLIDKADALCKELDCKVLSISSNPFDDDNALIEVAGPSYVMESFAQIVDLNKIHLRRDILRNLNKARKNGIVISDSVTPELISEWYRIHVENMQSHGAAPIPKWIYDSFLKYLVPKDKCRFLFAFHHGKMISGSVFVHNKNVIDAYMVSCSIEKRKYNANYLMVYELLEWAKNKGIRIFNWMSSDKKCGSLYQWKAGWGTKDIKILYLTKVVQDIGTWRNMSIDEFRKIYKTRYVIPFHALKDPGKNYVTKNEVSELLE